LGNVISSARLPNSSYANPGVVVSVAGSGIRDSSLSGVVDFYAIDDVKYNATSEPGTLVLLGSGMLAGVGVLRRKILL